MEAKKTTNSANDEKRDFKDMKSQSLIRPSSSAPASAYYRVLPDDIECEEWLTEVGLEQYRETFLSNFTHGGKYLSRKRLSQVRLQDFSKMNITNFDHQKILFEHIKITLQHEYANPTRRRMSQILSPMKATTSTAAGKDDSVSGVGRQQQQAKDFKKNFEKLENDGVDGGGGDGEGSRRNSGAGAEGGERRNSKSLKKQESSQSGSTNTTTETIEQRKKAQRAVIRKRNSFDGKVWETIHKYRGTPSEGLPPQPTTGGGGGGGVAVSSDVAKKKGPRRRSTFDGLPTANDDVTKGKMYGNMV
jgi:hypothetical protein